MLETNYTIFNQTVYDTISKLSYGQFIAETAESIAAIRSLADQAIGAFFILPCRNNPSLSGCTPYILAKAYSKMQVIDESVYSIAQQANNIFSDISLNYSVINCWNRNWSQCSGGISAYLSSWVFDYFIS